MPKASELPDSLKPLARRQAVDVRHSHFGHDAEALVKRMREALGEEVPVAESARRSVMKKPDQAGGVCGRQSALRQ